MRSHSRRSQRSRHIERRYLKIRELVAQGHIKVVYKPTADNHADVLTKSLPRELHDKHCDALMNRTWQSGAYGKPGLRQLNDAFKLTLKPAAFFLGNNVTVHDGAQGGAP